MKIVADFFTFLRRREQRSPFYYFTIFCFLIIECCFKQEQFRKAVSQSIRFFRSTPGLLSTQKMAIDELQASIDSLEKVPMTVNFISDLRKFPEKFSNLSSDSSVAKIFLYMSRLRRPHLEPVNIIEKELSKKTINYLLLLKEYFHRNEMYMERIAISKLITFKNVIEYASKELLKKPKQNDFGV